MALEKILEYYESRICALMGVNRRVINLGSDPTYENSKVALNDFWERTIVPMRRRHASTLSSQLLPLFGLDPAQYRLRFDFSDVEALRENLDALHARWRETFAAGGIDLFTFQEKIGLKPDEKYRGRYVKASSAFEETESGDEVKFNPLQPRDRDGKWTSGGGGFLAPDDGLTNIGGSASSRSNYEEAENKAIKDLKQRARNGSKEVCYLFDMDSGRKLQYAEAKDDNPDEVEFDDGLMKGVKNVSSLHHHRQPEPPSEADWDAFIKHPEIKKLVIVTSDNTYTLIKPENYQRSQHPVWGNASPASIYLYEVSKLVKDTPYKGTKLTKIPREVIVPILETVNDKLALELGVDLQRIK